MSTENYEQIKRLALKDVSVLEEKGKTYGRSWCSRGGVGAFMMMARKWDRIENIAKGLKYDIFEAGVYNAGDILDDISDLRAYLLLVHSEVLSRKSPTVPPKYVPGENWAVPICDVGSERDLSREDWSEPGPSYVNQDR